MASGPRPCEGITEQQHAIGLDDLDLNILVTVLKFLSPQEVATCSLVCRLLRNAAEAGVLWQSLYDTALCRRVKERLLPPPAQITDWRGAVIRGLMLTRLQYGCWERLQPAAEPGSRPCPREGHAAASWGADSMILFGGWGSGIRNDLFILDRVYDSGAEATRAAAAAAGSATQAAAAAAGGAGGGVRLRSGQSGAASSCSAASGTAGGGGGGGGGDGEAAAAATAAAPWSVGGGERRCGWRWRVPRVAGQRPAVRYGHSATRCGPRWDQLVVYGGMQAGGYTAEVAGLAVLRPHAGAAEGGSSSAAASASSAAPCAAAAAPYEYEWFHPTLSGPDPGARGYHAACASEDGTKLFVFGGIARRDSIASLAVINLTTWTVEIPTTSGTPPSPRFGCSLVAYDNRLWVVGGGNGSDLARSGHDLADCFTLDLATWEWSPLETTNRPHCDRALGRCHASTLVGSKLLLFGGSLNLGNEFTWLDLQTRTWGRPTGLLGQPPGKRMSAVVALSGSDLLVFAGWIYSAGEMGDLSRFRLLPPDAAHLARARQVAAAAAAATAAAPSGSGAGGSTSAAAAGAGASAAGLGRGGWGMAANAAEQLTELLSSQIARYYELMRSAQVREEAGANVPLALVREMHDTMMTIRLLREHADELEEQREGQAWQQGEQDEGGAQEEEEEEEDGSGEGVGEGEERQYDSEETGEEETEEEEEEGGSGDEA